jgi:pyruvate formate lyase activating enzyme
MQINYFNISWISTDDGPGKRVVLFLQKCHLDCAWCHSPHSQGESSPLLYFSNLCLNCGVCIETCPSNAHAIKNNEHTINRDKCRKCGECISTCPVSNENGGALALPTKSVNVHSLYHKIQPQLLLLKEIGGLTISGGEPLLQVKAVRELLKLCKQDNIHTAVETSGIIPVKDYEKISSLVDCWLLGFRLTTNKEKIDDHLYNIFSESLSYLANLSNSKIIARIPIIPNHTAFIEYYDKVIKLLKSYKINDIDLLPYNIHTSLYYNACGQIMRDEKILSATQENFEFAKNYFLT